MALAKGAGGLVHRQPPPPAGQRGVHGVAARQRLEVLGSSASKFRALHARACLRPRLQRKKQASLPSGTRPCAHLQLASRAHARGPRPRRRVKPAHAAHKRLLHARRRAGRPRQHRKVSQHARLDAPQLPLQPRRCCPSRRVRRQRLRHRQGLLRRPRRVAAAGRLPVHRGVQRLCGRGRRRERLSCTAAARHGASQGSRQRCSKQAADSQLTPPHLPAAPAPLPASRSQTQTSRPPPSAS